MNLKTETIEILKEHNKTIEDVLWVGNSHYHIPLDIFWKMIDCEYDNGWGVQEVSEELKVVGKDWWLERESYDGSEWWEFKTVPAKPDKEIKTFSSIPSVVDVVWGNDFDFIAFDAWKGAERV